MNDKRTRPFWLRQELRVSVCPSVRPSGTSLSKALNLHLSLIVMSQICLRLVSGQSQVSRRSLCAYFVRQTEPKILRLVLVNFPYFFLIVELGRNIRDPGGRYP